MREGVPVAVYLQGLSLLLGLVAVIIPVAITVSGAYISRRFSNRMDSLAADPDEALDRNKDLESTPNVTGEANRNAIALFSFRSPPMPRRPGCCLASMSQIWSHAETRSIDVDDLSGLIAAFRCRDACWKQWQDSDPEADWTANWCFAEAAAIRAADCNLSANRRRPLSRARVAHCDPLDILEELRGIETQIPGEIDELTEAVRGVAAK